MESVLPETENRAQATAICTRYWQEARNDAESYEPPQDVQEAAQQGLDYRKEYGRGGTDTGIARARDLSNGKRISRETLARMKSFFARHKKNRVPPTEKKESDGGPTSGWIAWLLWGGDAGKRWAESIVEDSMDHKQVLRVDYSDAPAMRRTDEGYLTGMAKVARIGIQAYRNGDGTVRRELRRPEEAFAKRALDSFKNLPVTMGHPPEKIVTAENAKRLGVGHIGENIHVDGRWIVMPITVTDAETIQQIEGGEAFQLSAGYLSEVLDEAGEYDGEVYDAVQTQIMGNHVAIVQQARAGADARLNLDAADAVAVDQNQIKNDGDEKMSDKTVMLRVDGIEYAVPPEVERYVAKLDEQAQAQKTDLEQAKQDAETNKAKLDEANAELEKLKADNSDEKIKEAAKARIDLERKAMTVLDEETVKTIGDMSDRQIQEAVVKAVHTDADLTEASDIYVQARFDAALDTHKAHGDAMAKQRQQVKQPVADGKGAKSLADKKAEAEDEIKNMYRKKDKK